MALTMNIRGYSMVGKAMHYEAIVRDERPPLVCTGQERISCI